MPELTEPLKDAQRSLILREFQRYKTSVQDRAQKTLDEYLLDLRLFFKYTIAFRNDIDYTGEDFMKTDISGCDEKFLQSITADDIYGFMDYLTEERKISKRSAQRKLSAIKSLFKFAVVTRRTDNNPARDIDRAAARIQQPKFLTLKESQQLLSSINSGNVRNRVRDYAIVLMFLNTGLRLSELVGINTEDFDRSMSSLMVTGKRSKQRIVYVNPSVAEALTAYLDSRREEEEEKYGSLYTEKGGKHPLFVSSHRQRISNKTVQWLVEKHLNAAGLGYKQLSTHKLRHTAATLMYREGGVDIRVLQDILGHEQLSTTQIYTHVVSTDIEKGTYKNPLAEYSPNGKKDKDS